MDESDRVDASDRVRDAYDTVARDYADTLAGELPAKPVDRAMYRLFAELVTADLDAGGAVGASTPTVGDVGCGPGHVAAHLAGLGLRPVGVDLSPGMITEARRRFPHLEFRVGSMLDPGGLGDPDGAWDGAVAAYAIVHFDAAARALALAELARAVRPGGWLLLAFHIEDEQTGPGGTHHLADWWGHEVDLDFHFIDPVEVAAQLSAAGFAVAVHTHRQPWPGEAPTRRALLLAQRDRPHRGPDTSGP